MKKQAKTVDKNFYETLLPNPSSPNADSDSLFTKFYKESV